MSKTKELLINDLDYYDFDWIQQMIKDMDISEWEYYATQGRYINRIIG